MSAPVSSLSPWVDRRRGRCQMGISAELSVGNVVVQLRHKEFFVRRCFHVPFMLGELAANSGVTYLLLLLNSLRGVASRHIHTAVIATDSKCVIVTRLGVDFNDAISLLLIGHADGSIVIAARLSV